MSGSLGVQPAPMQCRTSSLARSKMLKYQNTIARSIGASAGTSMQPVAGPDVAASKPVSALAEGVAPSQI